MRIIAFSQLSHAGPGRAYYERKIAEGKTQKEAVRALKRQTSDVVYRQLVRTPNVESGLGRTTRDDSYDQRGRLTP